MLKKFINKKTILTNTNSLIGKKAIVIKEINNLQGTGQIKIGGEIWSAQNESDTTISENQEVEIIKIEGVKLIVKQLPINVS